MSAECYGGYNGRDAFVDSIHYDRVSHNVTWEGGQLPYMEQKHQCCVCKFKQAFKLDFIFDIEICHNC